jgi:hypothetical protein
MPEFLQLQRLMHLIVAKAPLSTSRSESSSTNFVGEVALRSSTIISSDSGEASPSSC